MGKEKLEREKEILKRWVGERLEKYVDSIQTREEFEKACKSLAE